MDWLKNAIGEENYNSLGDETISKLKGFLGSKKFIEDDKGKFIEKHVFNEQREQLKEANNKIKEFEQELNNRKDLITSDEHKLQLIEAEKTFNEKLKQIEEQHKLEQENNMINNSLMNMFVANGATNPEFMLNNVKRDQVILKDGKIANCNEILENMRQNVPGLFQTMNPNIPSDGQSNTTTKQTLINQYNEYMKAGNAAKAMGVMGKIKELDKK